MARVSNSYSSASGSSITVVANYSALPNPTTVSGQFFWCENSQGTSWLPGSLGGTYYNSGMYYSNGVSWSFVNVPYQATQSEVNTGTNTDKFVTPSTLKNSSQFQYLDATSSIQGQLDARVRYWGSAIDGASIANTLTITATYSQLIPANTFVAGDVVLIDYRATSPGAKTSITNHYFYVNTSNSLSGATQLAIYATAATSRTLQFNRKLSIKGVTTKFVNPAASLSTDSGVSSALTTSTIDWTVDQHIIFAIGHTVADQTMFGDFYSIQKK